MENQGVLKEEFISMLFEAFEKHQLECSEHKANLLFMFYVELIERNKVMNLTAITKMEDVIYKHFIDCILIEKYHLLEDAKRIIDVGTGAGFPGLVLAIMYEHIEFVLMDSLQKRILFLKDLVQTLDLKNVELIHSRAEELAFDQMYREQFCAATSRAVANLSTLSEYCLPFVKTGGKFIAYKSQEIDEEVNNASHALKILGGNLIKVEQFDLEYEHNRRSLVVIEKKHSSPKKYPRKAGIPSKQPL